MNIEQVYLYVAAIYQFSERYILTLQISYKCFFDTTRIICVYKTVDSNESVLLDILHRNWCMHDCIQLFFTTSCISNISTYLNLNIRSCS